MGKFECQPWYRFSSGEERKFNLDVLIIQGICMKASAFSHVMKHFKFLKFLFISAKDLCSLFLAKMENYKKFRPEDHGLESSFKLTSYTKLKG